MGVAQKRDGGAYYYKFKLNGKYYTGTCIGCTTKRDAERYEREKRHFVEDITEAKSVNKLVERRRAELTGKAEPIKLADAFELSLAKPRAKQAAAKRIEQKRMMFGDFCAFMAATHPDATELAAVTKAHAEEYIALIQRQGRFLPKNTTNNMLSSSTLRRYHESIAEVFSVLADDAGLDRSPFDGIPKPAKQESQRDILTLRELGIIFKNLDEFTRPLFTLATFTGLREGDICMLRWRDIDPHTKQIKLAMHKTGKPVEIPLYGRVLDLIEHQHAISDGGEYVFPEHAAMYTKNPSGVSYRVKKFLASLDISTNRENDGRRASSVKDLHSCRHCFVHYTSNEGGAPLATVKSIVGHTSLSMTEHYADHITTDEKRRALEAIENIILPPPLPVDGETVDATETAAAPEHEKMTIATREPSQAPKTLRQAIHYSSICDIAKDLYEEVLEAGDDVLRLQDIAIRQLNYLDYSFTAFIGQLFKKSPHVKDMVTIDSTELEDCLLVPDELLKFIIFLCVGVQNNLALALCAGDPNALAEFQRRCSEDAKRNATKDAASRQLRERRLKSYRQYIANGMDNYNACREVYKDEHGAYPARADLMETIAKSIRKYQPSRQSTRVAENKPTPSFGKPEFGKMKAMK